MKFSPVVILTVLGLAYLLLAAVMNDSGLPYPFVFFTTGTAVIHLGAAKYFHQRRP